MARTGFDVADDDGAIADEPEAVTHDYRDWGQAR